MEIPSSEAVSSTTFQVALAMFYNNFVLLRDFPVITASYFITDSI